MHGFLKVTAHPVGFIWATQVSSIIFYSNACDRFAWESLVEHGQFYHPTLISVQDVPKVFGEKVKLPETDSRSDWKTWKLCFGSPVAHASGLSLAWLNRLEFALERWAPVTRWAENPPAITSFRHAIHAPINLPTKLHDLINRTSRARSSIVCNL